MFCEGGGCLCRCHWCVDACCVARVVPGERGYCETAGVVAEIGAARPAAVTGGENQASNICLPAEKYTLLSVSFTLISKGETVTQTANNQCLSHQ